MTGLLFFCFQGWHHTTTEMTRRGGGEGESLTEETPRRTALNPTPAAGRGCEASVQIRQPYGIVGT